jgi:hypothetical protein
VKAYWIIAAGAGGLLAIYFALQHEYDRAFISAVIGSVIWFLGYRSHMKNLIAKEAPEENVESDEDEKS